MLGASLRSTGWFMSNVPMTLVIEIADFYVGFLLELLPAPPWLTMPLSKLRYCD